MNRRLIMPFLAIMAALSLVFGSTAAGTGQAEKTEKDKKPDPFSALKFRYIGPVGNRIIAVVGIPGDPERLLRGRRLGRDLQDDGRRRQLGAHLRQSARLVDRLSRRRPVGRERRLGRDRRDVHPQRHLPGERHLQVDRRRQDLEMHGAREHGPHRPDRHRSAEPGRRLRRGHGPRLRAPAGARRVPHHRRRQDLGAGALRRREHRVLRHRHGPDQPANPLRRDVADAHQDVGEVERRARRQPPRLARRRNDVDAPEGQRPSRHRDRQGRPRRLRRATPIASTPSSKPPPRDSGDRTTAANPGRS